MYLQSWIIRTSVWPQLWFPSQFTLCQIASIQAVKRSVKQPDKADGLLGTWNSIELHSISYCLAQYLQGRKRLLTRDTR